MVCFRFRIIVNEIQLYEEWLGGRIPIQFPLPDYYFMLWYDRLASKAFAFREIYRKVMYIKF